MNRPTFSEYLANPALITLFPSEVVRGLNYPGLCACALEASRTGRSFESLKEQLIRAKELA